MQCPSKQPRSLWCLLSALELSPRTLPAPGLPPWGAETLSRAAPSGAAGVLGVGVGPLGPRSQERLGCTPRERSPVLVVLRE